MSPWLRSPNLYNESSQHLGEDRGKPVGKTVLYFGCRNKDKDYLYEEELAKCTDSGLLKLYVAFSRDQEHKVYVTHLLEENKEEVWEIIGKENVKVKMGACTVLRVASVLISVALALEPVVGDNPLPRDMASVTSGFPQLPSPGFHRYINPEREDELGWPPTCPGPDSNQGPQIRSQAR
ncbi:NADPH--cytochrome P450 reductase [Chionoecetes opilio]|uniref:NADPH--hemoprotein reductase n=1 Tax=Chionoecetes opilio TaxID=41210 RepID=A0A8J4YL84_CHIOP|nr:NADPH--cytochrome P450 reductase [Chionoecetes opilio]